MFGFRISLISSWLLGLALFGLSHFKTPQADADPQSPVSSAPSTMARKKDAAGALDVCAARPDLCDESLPEMKPPPRQRRTSPRPTFKPITYESYLTSNAKHPALTQKMAEQRAFQESPAKTTFTTPAAEGGGSSGQGTEGSTGPSLSGSSQTPGQSGSAPASGESGNPGSSFGNVPYH